MAKSIKKLSTVILAAALIFGMFFFADFPTGFAPLKAAAAGETTFDYSVVISGSGTVLCQYADQSRAISSSATLECPSGSTVTLTAQPGDDSRFLFWVNSETQRILSYYTGFESDAVTYRNLEAVFTSKEAGRHYVCYVTMMGTIFQGMECDIGSEIEPENVPVFDGYLFTKWDHTPEQIAAQSGDVFVYPEYEEDTTKCTVTYTINETGKSAVYERFTEAAVNAPAALNGKIFQYWREVTEDGEGIKSYRVASYYNNYHFYIVKDTVLEAVYGDSVPVQQPIVRILGSKPDTENNKLYFYEEYSAPKGYTVVQHGILLTNKVALANQDSGSGFIIGASGVAKGTSATNTLAGIYTLGLNFWGGTRVVDGKSTFVYPYIYARAYLIVRDPEGNLLPTIYSDVYMDPNGTTTITVEDTNVDDMFDD